MNAINPKINEVILLYLENEREPIALYINCVLRRSTNIRSTSFIDMLPQGEYTMWEARTISHEWSDTHSFYVSPEYFLPSRLTDIPFEAFINQDKWKLTFHAY